MKLVEAEKKHIEKWDEYIDKSINGTIFHKRKFLNYHKNKFENKEKYLVVKNGEEVFAQISMTISFDNNGKLVAKSPFGGSYGSFTFINQPNYILGKEIAVLFVDYLKSINVDRCILIPSISCCNRKGLDVFSFNLLEQGFHIVNRDISSVLIFNENESVEKQLTASVRSGIKSSLKKGVTINCSPNIEKVYNVLQTEQHEKFHKEPTHSLKEFLYLHEKFPKEIRSISAEYDGIMVAAMTTFLINQEVDSSFYLCIDKNYRTLNPLRPVVLQGLQIAKEEGRKYFDFGTSSINMVANEPVWNFKEGFTKDGMFRDTFEWENNDNGGI